MGTLEAAVGLVPGTDFRRWWPDMTLTGIVCLGLMWLRITKASGAALATELSHLALVFTG